MSQSVKLERVRDLQKSTVQSLVLSQSIFIILLPLFYRFTSYLHPIVLGMIWVCLTTLVFFIVFWLRKETLLIPYPFFIAIFIFYNIALVILLFLRPSEQSYDTWNLVPFATISFYLSGQVPLLVVLYNLVANVGLFVPWGLFFMTKRFSTSQLIYIPFISIAIIELTQFLTKRGSLDIDDLILNLTGVLFGYALFPIWQKVFGIRGKNRI